jgi:hypothetical protein
MWVKIPEEVVSKYQHSEKVLSSEICCDLLCLEDGVRKLNLPVFQREFSGFFISILFGDR